MTDEEGPVRGSSTGTPALRRRHFSASVVAVPQDLGPGIQPLRGAKRVATETQRGVAAPSKVTALLAAPLVKSTVLATPDLYASSVSEKRKLRFGIQGPDGRRSRVWTLSAKATGSDVFLIPCDAPCNLHISLHNERYWHIQMEDEEGKHPSRLGVVPEPILAGKVTRAFLVAISPGGLTGFPEPPDPRVKWCPPATSPGNWLISTCSLRHRGWRVRGA